MTRSAPQPAVPTFSHSVVRAALTPPGRFANAAAQGLSLPWPDKLAGEGGFVAGGILPRRLLQFTAPDLSGITPLSHGGIVAVPHNAMGVL